MLFFVALPSYAVTQNLPLVDTSHTAASKPIESAYKRLQLIRQKNKLATQNLDSISKEIQTLVATAGEKKITKGDVERADLELALASANLDAANITKTEAQQNIDTTMARLRDLEKQLQDVTLAAGATSEVNQRIAKLQAAINNQKSLVKWQQRQSDALEHTIQLAQQILNLRVKWKNTLFKQYDKQQQLQRQQALEKQELALQEEQRKWINRLSELNTKLQNTTSEQASLMSKEEVELQILQAQENSNLIHLQLVMVHISSMLASMVEDLNTNQSVTTLNNQINQIKVMRGELNSLMDLVQRKIELVKQRMQIEMARNEKGVTSKASYEAHQKLLANLLTKYQSYDAKLKDLLTASNSVLAKIQEKLNQSLARRQGLPGFSLQAWANLSYKLMAMPSLTLQTLGALKEQVYIAIEKVSYKRIFGIVAVQALWLLVWLWVRGIFTALVEKFGRDLRTITDNIRFVMCQLIRRNLLTAYIISAFILLLWLLGVPVKSFTPLIVLASVFLVFKIAMGLTRLVLIETSTDAEGKDVKLYYHLQWALWGGGILTMLTVLAQQLPVGFEVRDFFNRLFSLFLLVVAVLLLRGWGVVPYLMAPYVENSRPYVMRAIKYLSFLVPLTLLITALIGFFGYVDLAWTISRYEGQFLMILVGFILVQGFFKDFMEWLSELLIRRMRNGWLWTQAILRPLDKIIQVGLFISAVAILFYLYGWGKHSYVPQKIWAFMHIHLIELKGTVITPLGLIEFVIIGFVLYWLSRWTREFAYRWLFSRTEDVGLRNSLAAFTQYITVIISLLIALKLIGLDFSGIEYILGGFAIAAGFGMRDLLKNYASGMLLLIERPVRTGDLVSIGNFEGQVTHIGMRAMTVRTWDHMEVLVPNSETFDKPFTNWTHQDGIVRTVICLKFSRNDDPLLIRSTIFEVIGTIPEIVSSPTPQVFMKELSEDLLNFDLRYFINLQTGSSRVAVRSQVLFALWEAFKAKGIKPPYPQQELHVRSLPIPIVP